MIYQLCLVIVQLCTSHHGILVFGLHLLILTLWEWQEQVHIMNINVGTLHPEQQIHVMTPTNLLQHTIYSAYMYTYIAQVYNVHWE